MLTREEVQSIVEKFDEKTLKEVGIFELHMYGGSPDESCIKANRQGLQMFALELLKGSASAKYSPEGKKIIHFSLPKNDAWIEEKSDIFLDHIELLDYKQKNPPPEENKKLSAVNWLGFVATVLFVLMTIVSAVIGVITIFRWIF